ncbi:hypothetical protein M9H77_03717 [Catharanthus roseus]|uniref:Uncharacterized protein n=1 Tax=Catharanthus roseus TaxID=4058 RepID=A0ACC0CC22_CATRO|nr:hypothetical protein M9H77_03717 [Catharanthus roseus]
MYNHNRSDNSQNEKNKNRRGLRNFPEPDPARIWKNRVVAERLQTTTALISLLRRSSNRDLFTITTTYLTIKNRLMNKKKTENRSYLLQQEILCLYFTFREIVGRTTRKILPRDPQGLGQNGDGNWTSLASSVFVHAVIGRHRTSFQRRKRRIPQVNPVSLKQIQTLYLSTKTGPFLSKPSHTHGLKDDSRHKLLATVSRRAKRKKNCESVRRRD